MSLSFAVVSMPHCSERAKAIEELENTLATHIVSNSMGMVASYTNLSSSASSSSTFNSGDEGLDNVSTLYNYILSQRYFAERHHVRVDSSRMANEKLRMNHNRFRARFRMSPTSFDRIWNMIKDHNIFANVSTCAKFDPRLQILIVLFMFGAYGNGASKVSIAVSLYISTGVLSKFTKCVMIALLSLKKSVVCWPMQRKKKPSNSLFKNPMDFPTLSA